MSTEASSRQEASEPSKTEKRAEYEAFEFRVPVPGRVRVENASYGDESGEHVYVVSIQNGEAVSCSCPADEYRSGRCKHRHAVENQPAVLLAASASDRDESGGENESEGREPCTGSERPDMGGGESSGVDEL
jgi:hypothetical protein